MKKFPLLVSALAAGISVSTFAQTPGIDLNGTVGYVIDQRAYVAKSGFGLCWRTGYWTPAMAIAECDPDLVAKPAPAPVAAKPAPAPAPAPKPCDFSVVLATDATFAFDKSDLNAAAKSVLDKDVMTKLGNCAKIDSITVTGHSDRLGSEKYNETLSGKRAEAVKSYLAGQGVQGITAVAAGESQPLPDVKCEGKMSRAKQISCLAPNRRVVIDVKGTAK